MPKWLERLYEDLATGRRGSDSPWAQPLVEAMHVIVILLRESRQDRLPVRAAMLSYWTAVAIVPILVIGFTLSAPLGAGPAAREAVLHLLYDTILTESVEEVAGALDLLLEGASLKALGLVGVAGIMVIGSQLYFNAERAYNDIFDSRVRRSLFLRFTLFYAGITLAPSLIAAGFVVTARLPTEVNVFARAVPVALTSVVFVAAIRLLPVRRVRWGPSMIGGIFSAVAFEAAKAGFSAYTRLMGTSDSMAGVYGSLAFLPVFLLWLMVVWMVVLIGVEIAYLAEHYEHLIDAQRRDAGDPFAQHRRPDALFGLGLMAVIARTFIDGRPALNVDALVGQTGADPRHVQAALDILCDAGLVVETEDKRYLPARPPDELTAADILGAWRQTSAPTVERGSASAQVIGHIEGLAVHALSQPGAWIPAKPAEVHRLDPSADPRPSKA